MAEESQNSGEYRALTATYEDLCNAMPINDLIPKMIANRVISLNDKAEIRSKATDREKVQCFISKLTGELALKENARFYKFIAVMKQSPKCKFIVERMEKFISDYGGTSGETEAAQQATPNPQPLAYNQPIQQLSPAIIDKHQNSVNGDQGIDMKLIRKHVIPRISADWETVSAYLEYDIPGKDLISKTHNGRPKDCCVALLEDWITTDNGVKPKTWEKLVQVLSEIGSLAMVTRQIKQKLIQEGVLEGHGVRKTEVQQPQQQEQLRPQQQIAQATATDTRAFERSARGYDTPDSRQQREPDYLVKSDELEAMADKKILNNISDAKAKRCQSQTQILLVTANKHEYSAVLAVLQPLPGFQSLLKYKHIFKVGPLGKHATYIFGKFGAFNAAVQMMVTQGPLSAQDVVTIAADCFGRSLHAIFAVGVACGVENKNDHLHVLVSKFVSFYNAARHGTAENGKYSITNRAIANMPTSTFLIDYFNQKPKWPTENPEWLIDNTETVKRLTTKPKVHMGNILSGEYLVDNKDFKKQLLENFAPEAIGIEMEGAGLYHEYRNHNYEILVVKAVCDFGDGKKNKEYQPTAALLAAECLHHYLDNDTMASELRCWKEDSKIWISRMIYDYYVIAVAIAVIAILVGLIFYNWIL